MSTITKAEMYFGSTKSQTPDVSRVKQDAFLNHLASIPFDEQAANAYGPIRTLLEAAAMPIGQLDTLIAAIAIAHGLILVTHNTREFAPVPNLALEDWEI